MEDIEWKLWAEEELAHLGAQQKKLIEFYETQNKTWFEAVQAYSSITKDFSERLERLENYLENFFNGMHERRLEDFYHAQINICWTLENVREAMDIQYDTATEKYYSEEIKKLRKELNQMVMTYGKH